LWCACVEYNIIFFPSFTDRFSCRRRPSCRCTHTHTYAAGWPAGRQFYFLTTRADEKIKSPPALLHSILRFVHHHHHHRRRHPVVNARPTILYTSRRSEGIHRGRPPQAVIEPPPPPTCVYRIFRETLSPSTVCVRRLPATRTHNSQQ